MKITSCPWCKGSGKKLQIDGGLTNACGEIVTFKEIMCTRCLGSGVIEFRPVKSITELSASIE